MVRRVLFSTGSLAAGGAERVVSSIINQLIDCNTRIVVVLWVDAPLFYPIDSRVEIVVLKQRFILDKMMAFRRVVAKYCPNVVMSFLAPFNIATILSLLGTKMKIIVSERNDPRHVPFNAVMRKVRNFSYYFADAITVQTENNRRYFSHRLQAKCTVIFNPINIVPAMQGSALVTKKQPIIVAVSRLSKQKNLPMLINAFGRIALDYPQYKLYIYGEGDERGVLESLIGEKKLSERVILASAVKDVHKRILSAEIFVLSSNFEGMPNALLEAMGLGLPCISTRVSGAVDLIEHGVNGRLIPIGDELALEKELRLLIEDESLRAKLGFNASAIYSVLNPTKMIQAWIEYILGEIKEV